MWAGLGDGGGVGWGGGGGVVVGWGSPGGGPRAGAGDCPPAARATLSPTAETAGKARQRARPSERDNLNLCYVTSMFNSTSAPCKCHVATTQGTCLKTKAEGLLQSKFEGCFSFPYSFPRRIF